MLIVFLMVLYDERIHQHKNQLCLEITDNFLGIFTSSSQRNFLPDFPSWSHFSTLHSAFQQQSSIFSGSLQAFTRSFHWKLFVNQIVNRIRREIIAREAHLLPEWIFSETPSSLNRLRAQTSSNRKYSTKLFPSTSNVNKLLLNRHRVFSSYKVNENVCWGLSLHEFTFDSKLNSVLKAGKAQKNRLRSLWWVKSPDLIFIHEENHFPVRLSLFIWQFSARQ